MSICPVVIYDSVNGLLTQEASPLIPAFLTCHVISCRRQTQNARQKNRGIPKRIWSKINKLQLKVLNT